MKEFNIGKFIRIFLFLSFVIFLVINWNWVKGIFNYQTIYKDIVDSLREKFKIEKKVALKIPDIKLSESKSAKPKYTEKPDSLEIPKIEVSAPLIFIESNNNQDYEKALKKGVVHYSQSALPGSEGQTIILGHSAPPGWPKINYDWIFSRLNELSSEDEIIINYKNREYHYKVTQKYFLNPGQEIPVRDLTNSKNMLILISCWPPGVNLKRIAVEAELAI